MTQTTPTPCVLLPALPDAVATPPAADCTVTRREGLVILENGYLALEIPERSGVVAAVLNRLTGERLELDADRAGVGLAADGDGLTRWIAGAGRQRDLRVTITGDARRIAVSFAGDCHGVDVSLVYELAAGHFWAERRVVVDPRGREVLLQELYYGRFQKDVLRRAHHDLNLGTYDRPRLLGSGRQGGLFAGVGWWFYALDENGVYRNDDMALATSERFVSEPFYLGVYRREAPEPYPGWAWYRAFLQLRKDEYDKQAWWCTWNAGWGQWTIEIDTEAGRPYLDLCARLGVRSICFGSGAYGKPIAEYARVCSEDPVARENLRRLADRGLVAGCIEAGPVRDDWREPAVAAKHHAAMESLGATPGFGMFAFDYFYIHDTFAAKWRTTRYLRAARERLDFVSCDLGMAEYGPQYMREVLCNHPTDVEKADLSRFSKDWTGMLTFRWSRAEWQTRYGHVVPEVGLLYLATNYHNGGHPRKYSDPEPMQLLYDAGAYKGCLNFHDPFGYRDALVAVLAFSPFIMLGHLERTMREDDVTFTRALLDWLSANAPLLRRARVCHEDREGAVVSKLVAGRGPVFIINHGLATRRFTLTLPTDAQVQPVYPTNVSPFRVAAGQAFEVEVRGESVAVLDINASLASLPPENPRRFPMDVPGWRREGQAWSATIDVPDVRATLEAQRDPNLPRELLVIDVLGGGKSGAELGQTIADPDLQRTGRMEPLPQAYLDAVEVRGDRVETWKVGPWAFADRLWFAYRPQRPPSLTDPLPRLFVNGQPVRLYPRVQNDSKDWRAWTCPLFCADLTSAVRWGAANTLRLEGTPADMSPAASLCARA